MTARPLRPRPTTRRRQCTHAREGIVTTHPDAGPIGDGPHAARSVCSRPGCIQRAIEWARERTGMPAEWVPDVPR